MKKAHYLALILLCLLGPVASRALATADPSTVRWVPVSIPAEGKPGNWGLAQGSDVKQLSRAADGTLYAYANPSGTSHTLFKSADGGRSWAETGPVTDTIAALAPLPGNAATIYYATTAAVYRSTDAGERFATLAGSPGGAGSDNVTITSLDVAPLDGSNIVVVGTRDTGSGQYGGVYLLDEAATSPAWLDTGIGSYDVYAVALSPHFAADRQIVAVVTDETDTLVTTRLGSSGWGATVGDARLDRDNSEVPTPVAVDTPATIRFPADYSATVADGAYVQFIALDAGSHQGDVYRIDGVEAPDGSVATDLNLGAAYGLSNLDVTGLAVSGDTLMAGAADSAEVYLSTDGGATWTRSQKPPTGESRTEVLMAPDSSPGEPAYTATTGSQSAVSVTTDGGVTWNQVGLIDTSLSDIVDLAPSPGYDRDNSLFLLTYGSEHSLWRRQYDEPGWQRVFTSTAADVDSLDGVGLPPDYGPDNEVVFLAGTSNGSPAIWRSADNGQRFGSPHTTRDPATGASFDIDAWVLAGDDTIFIGSYDGSHGLVYRTTNGGLSYAARATAGSQRLNSLTLSPAYHRDKTILAGNTAGWVYRSGDNGNSFEPLPSAAVSAPLTGRISVAFDPEFGTNRTVYAASKTADEGIYRFVIGSSTSWEGIDSNLPASGQIDRLAASAAGVLYATNPVANGGLERSLDPTDSSGPTFESVTRGLDDGVTLSGLWQHGPRLWAIDTTNTRLMTFTDSLSQPVAATSPANQAASLGTIVNYTVRNARLDWEALEGATQYQWQLDYDTDFSSVPDGFEDTTKASTVRLPTLEPDTTYYWRVRATGPVLSPWSASRSFTTTAGTERAAPQLITPQAGTGGVAIRPLFQWSAIAGAERYEMVVSTDPALDNPIILKMGDYALPATAWEANVNLDYATTYYWKVRAVGSHTSSEWSPVGSFITGPPPASPEPAPPTPPAQPAPPAPPSPPAATPSSPAAPVTPDWLIYLVGPLSLTIVLLIISVLVLALRRR